ncbi:ABC transporter substrate-binding protein [Sphaerisporangium aureirubrum]|uniref:ABC transporter substrate-binding protein n=1 Tax=Sphaerisporangium aureirubrum TaxID=1544736 RepID=A0ABW1NMJ0_9ACTN
MRRLLTGLAVAAVLVAASTACGSPSPNPPAAPEGGKQPDSVKVGVIPILDVAPIYLGKDKGFFSSRGMDLTMESGQGGAAIVPGVVSGQFQFGFSNVTSLMVAQSKGVPIKGVANGVASTGVDGEDFGGIVVKGDSPIRSAKDLAGKKVAVNTLKNIGDTSVRASVRKAGGDPGAVRFVEIAFPQMPAALDAGQVDAAWVVEPSLTAVKAKGGRVVASNFVDTAPDLTVALYFTSDKLQADNPDLVKRFQEAMRESLTYADAHPDEVRQILTTYTKIDAASLPGLILPKWPAEPNRASLEELAKLSRQDGLFATAPDLAKLVP